MNLSIAVGSQLRGTRCRRPGHQRIRESAAAPEPSRGSRRGLYSYPDIVIFLR
jgi:hypothetical protein